MKLSNRKLLDAIYGALTPEAQREVQLRVWATEVLRRRCPVSW